MKENFEKKVTIFVHWSSATVLTPSEEFQANGANHSYTYIVRIWSEANRRYRTNASRDQTPRQWSPRGSHYSPPEWSSSQCSYCNQPNKSTHITERDDVLADCALHHRKLAKQATTFQSVTTRWLCSTVRAWQIIAPLNDVTKRCIRPSYRL